MPMNKMSYQYLHNKLWVTVSPKGHQGTFQESENKRFLNRFKPASNFVLLIVPSRYFCSGSFCFMSWCLKFFVLLAPYVCFHIFS